MQALGERLTFDLIKWHTYGAGSEQFVERAQPDLDLLIVQEGAEMERLTYIKREGSLSR